MPDLPDQSQRGWAMDFHKVFSSLSIDASMKRDWLPFRGPCSGHITQPCFSALAANGLQGTDKKKKASKQLSPSASLKRSQLGISELTPVKSRARFSPSLHRRSNGKLLVI